MGLQQMVLQGLQDASASVRLAALRAMEPLASLAADQQQITGFHVLVAAMLQVRPVHLAD